MRHPGEGLYQSYGNYAGAAILSEEYQGPWASCLKILLGRLVGLIFMNILLSKVQVCDMCPSFAEEHAKYASFDLH